MNTNTVVGGILAILIIAGLIFYVSRDTSPTDGTATTTPSGSNSSTTAGAPTVVTTSSVAPSGTTAVVVGSVTPNGALTSYWYEYGSTANLGSKISSQTIGSGYASIPSPGYITGLTKNTTYYFRLVAENQYSKVSGAQYSFTTTDGTPAPVGGIPTAQTRAATGVTRVAANLNGEVNPNKAATQYWFEYGESPDLGNTTALQSVGSGSATMPASFSFSDLKPATTYYFRLNAQNQFGTVNGSVLNFKTSGPPLSVAAVVTTQVASPVATTTATIRGTVHPSGTQTTYWFEYSTDSLLATAFLKTTPKKSLGAGVTTTSVEADLSGLTAGTTYYYRTVAENTAGVVRGSISTLKTK